jgi:hypothetical protein
MKFLSVYFLLAIVVVSCKPDDIKVPVKNDYFPLKDGRYYIYNVDSVRYPGNANIKPDSTHYQLKDSVTSSFIDLSGQTAFRIEEYKRKNTTDPWRIYKVFSRLANKVDAEEVYGNLRYVKMVFPVAQNKSWNPNSYNITDSMHDITGKYIEVDKPYALAGLKYDKTALVQLQNDSNFVDYYEYYERYAANVGLISLRHDSVFHNRVPNQPTYDIGYRFKQTLTDYEPR